MSETQSEERQQMLDKNVPVGVGEKSETEVLSEDQCETVEQVKRVVAEVIHSEFSGPMPPPNIIREYNSVVPGAADRIIAMAEKQAAHRQEMESIMIRAESRDSFLGVLFAFCLGIGSIIAAIVMVIFAPENGGAFAGAVIGTGGLGTIIVTFIKSTRSNKGKKEQENETENKE